ncbi:DUF1330 domain-containing protein [Algoriphagus sp. AGSA1]|uniref:DUF1330 domain-containing protein n=1 Tax=Algoriphagus sp. AGSA1 TaxID=2907213 RepID=UPI001F2895B4|nr:DUF1330 domain-containing protein [Algoriphagus sp. AGSA1]MCE7054335.1 DUF1330 domain-containing protein [Algoriphagus sp. AGSA1]
MKQYIEATPDSGKEFYRNFHQKGRIVMLNLLRYRQIADYSISEELRPKKQLSGKQAYRRYLDHTLPLLEAAGSRIIFYGSSRSFLIGPDDEKWDDVLLVEHESVAKFMEFANSKEYLNYAGHRTAALEDSRLLPMIKSNFVDTLEKAVNLSV